MAINIIVISILALLLLLLSFYALNLLGKNKNYETQLSEATIISNDYELRFSKIIDIEKEIVRINQEKTELDKTITNLRQSYKDKKLIYDELVKRAAVYDESIELAELGIYKPHYDFDAPEKYKEEIDRIRDVQKEMVAQKTAITCKIEWTVDGSKTKGQVNTNKGIRLTARAFNNECEAAISNTTWNNAERMEQRIRLAFDAINKLNETNAITISPAYLDLKIREFRLAYEYQDKKYKQREEQASIRLQMREEAKLAQESEAALKEEDRYQKLLEKAKNEAERATGSKLIELEEKIAGLATDLAAAHEKSERAKSMAQQTRAGHVYVISNIGSFGKNVYKIGMTRRLEPDERIKELGDASVPFTFDVHAMIYSIDAPALENTLHRSLENHRINLVNYRKEFFEASLEQIEKVVREHYSEAEFNLTAEAREYKETTAIRAQHVESSAKKNERNGLPLEL